MKNVLSVNIPSKKWVRGLSKVTDRMWYLVHFFFLIFFLIKLLQIIRGLVIWTCTHKVTWALCAGYFCVSIQNHQLEQFKAREIYFASGFQGNFIHDSGEGTAERLCSWWWEQVVGTTHIKVNQETSETRDMGVAFKCQAIVTSFHQLHPSSSKFHRPPK